MNNWSGMDKYLFEFQDKLLTSYNSANLQISKDDDNSFLNGIVRFLCFALSETLYRNKVPLKSLKFSELKCEYISEDRTLEYTLPLVGDVTIVCGVCLLSNECPEPETQSSQEFRTIMQQNGIRGVFLEFKSLVDAPNGEQTKVVQEINGMQNEIVPKILNKITSNPKVLN